MQTFDDAKINHGNFPKTTLNLLIAINNMPLKLCLSSKCVPFFSRMNVSLCIHDGFC